MTEKERSLLQAWLLAEETRIYNELVERRNFIRFHDLDVVDCMEMMLILQRLQDFREFSRILVQLLHL